MGDTPNLELNYLPIKVVPTLFPFSNFGEKLFPERKPVNDRFRPKANIQHIDVIT
jgi:hypothetical protein